MTTESDSFFPLLLLPRWLFLLTCAPVFTIPGRAETDATAFSTDYGKVCLQARYHKPPSSLYARAVIQDCRLFSCKLLNAFCKLWESRGNPMHNILYVRGVYSCVWIFVHVSESELRFVCIYVLFTKYFSDIKANLHIE